MSAIMWFLYLADVVNSIGFISGLAVFITTVAICVTALIFTIAYCNGDIDEDKKTFFTKAVRKFSIILLVSIVFNVVTPSKNTIYMMLGVQVTGNLIQEASKSPITEKALQLLESKLDEAIKENTPNKGKEK